MWSVNEDWELLWHPRNFAQTWKTQTQKYKITQKHKYTQRKTQRLKLHPGGDVVSQWGTGTGRTSHVLCTASIYNTLLYTLHLASGHKTTIHCSVSTWRYSATTGAETWQYNVLKTPTKTECSREIRRAASPKTTLPLSQGQISDHGPCKSMKIKMALT